MDWEDPNQAPQISATKTTMLDAIQMLKKSYDELDTDVDICST